MNIFIQLTYLVATILFIVGIKKLNRTQEARQGNMLSAFAMLLAVVATLVKSGLVTPIEIFVCMLIGGAIGLIWAKKVEMTQMPEMVAIFNGFGGIASLFVAFSDYWTRAVEQPSLSTDAITIVSILLSVLIGGITFSGSMTAYGKLSGKISGNAIVFKGQHLLNLVLFVVAIVCGMLVAIETGSVMAMVVMGVVSLVLGILVVIPIGGADMPVVISLLNSYSGMAACTTGFVLNNSVLIVTGALVGASGIILTQIMCKAMNRSLVSVLLGGFGAKSGSGEGGPSGSEMVIKEVGVEEAAMIFDSSSSVIIVPGYGMAVAQAQHVVREMMDLLQAKGVNVRFAIHPVAGRMPGHMNVLLAESNVPYDKLIEMDQINDDFANTDVVLVVGANDVVNPAARTNPASPIYEMPILNVDKARTVIVSKRSMAAGYAGIENELFGYPNCLMLFGDAKSTLTKMVGELKEL
ncbi:NAD(P) transhydrogenase subunit beta [Dyadobacter jejuensis]|uniref:NAD(P) transhydrogenase subunit beta n=1 Tax=Dyadobacter jejuensis TaxID=1082580 RepID=A0A316ARB4_9BACT|nr:NAD(P)(+) transhydrogenase (Re/Si-specific) subunit beta [Dyadobacter jejuensis]PWJ59839.1 NAD(P) transhydrogenase subunit beta [Dyadobacter jejuensis]